jgi:hypothetical protein
LPEDGLGKKGWREKKSETNNEKILRGGGELPSKEAVVGEEETLQSSDEVDLKERIRRLEEHHGHDTAINSNIQRFP